MGETWVQGWMLAAAFIDRSNPASNSHRTPSTPHHRRRPLARCESTLSYSPRVTGRETKASKLHEPCVFPLSLSLLSFPSSPLAPFPRGFNHINYSQHTTLGVRTQMRPLIPRISRIVFLLTRSPASRIGLKRLRRSGTRSILLAIILNVTTSGK